MIPYAEPLNVIKKYLKMRSLRWLWCRLLSLLMSWHDFIAYRLIQNEALKRHVDGNGITHYRKGQENMNEGSTKKRLSIVYENVSKKP